MQCYFFMPLKFGSTRSDFTLSNKLRSSELVIGAFVMRPKPYINLPVKAVTR